MHSTPQSASGMQAPWPRYDAPHAKESTGQRDRWGRSASSRGTSEPNPRGDIYKHRLPDRNTDHSKNATHCPSQKKCLQTPITYEIPTRMGKKPIIVTRLLLASNPDRQRKGQNGEGVKPSCPRVLSPESWFVLRHTTNNTTHTNAVTPLLVISRRGITTQTQYEDT